MLATFLIEIVLLVYALWRYRLTPVTRLAGLLLFFLAAFQFAEYMICGALGLTGVEWARFGFAAITLLPPLGLHLALTLAKKRLPWLLALAYASAGFFLYFFVFVAGSLYGEECRPNYVVFHVRDWLVYLYSGYYYGWLLLTTGLSLRWARHSRYGRQLRALAVGYAAFIVPVTLATILNPSTIAGIPSIMCGFAVLMALALVGWVLPGAAPIRKK